MVITNSTLDSKEEGPEITNRKDMENTVDNRAEENCSLPSKMPDTSSDLCSEAEAPPQTVMAWMMVSVAVGFLAIYTLIQWVSNKLTQEMENGQITEKQINQQQKNTTNISSPDKNKTTVHNYDTCCTPTNHETDLQTAHENRSESHDSSGGLRNLAVNDFCQRNEKMNENDLPEGNLLALEKNTLSTEKVEHNTSDNVDIFSCCDGNHQCEISKVSEMCETHKITEEKNKDTVKQPKTDEQPHPFHSSIECRECHSIHNCNVTSVHMGPGFTGNLSISSECGDLACRKSLSTSNCRSAATLQSYVPGQTTPVRVNNLHTKCLTCNTEMSSTGLSSSVKHLVDCIKLHSKEEDPQLPNADKFPTFIPEDRVDSPEHQPPSTIHCMLTTLKSLSCDCDVAKDLPVLSSHPEHRQSHETFPLQESLNYLYDKNDNRIGEPRLPSQNFSAQSKDTTNATKTVSDSLNYLANYHTPQETTDGALFSKNSLEDAFIFPQDNDMVAEQHSDLNNTKDEIELDTPRSKFLRSIRDDPALSKSLDSQIESLKKGCRLLEKKPSKSALRSSGSEECLKKFVHFPPDIRHIRTVHKYHSFDETWCDFGADHTRDEEHKLN